MKRYCLFKNGVRELRLFGDSNEERDAFLKSFDEHEKENHVAGDTWRISITNVVEDQGNGRKDSKPSGDSRLDGLRNQKSPQWYFWVPNNDAVSRA